MNFKYLKFIIVCTLIVIGACDQARDANDMYESEKVSTATDSMISSSAAVINPNDTQHQFIRTADLKFRVKNVLKSTNAIEDIVAKSGGFVTQSQLQNNVSYTENRELSKDSVLEITFYSLSSHLTVRVPNTLLDSVLKEFAKEIDFLDYRNITADDVSLSLLSNKLSEKRSKESGERIDKTIDKNDKKPEYNLTGEEIRYDKMTAGDQAHIANMALMDKISFSTVTINMYDREHVRKEVIANQQNIRNYEPGFGTKALQALSDGWQILAQFILFLLRIWGLILFFVIAWIGFKWVRRKYFKKG